MIASSNVFDYSEDLDLGIGIDKWLHYNPSVGVDAVHVIGLPGSGKSNMASGMALQCMLHKDERLVMPGDRFCEWRHFPFHPVWKEEGWKIKILVPKDVKILYHNFEESKIPRDKWFEEVDFANLDIMPYFQDKDLRLVVVYDQHLRLADRAQLWADIMQQLLNRATYLDTAIMLLFHEAGVLFPQMAKEKHWQGINKFSELFVETRKGLVRVILVSQIKTEVESTLRMKCLYKIFRKCWPGNKEPVPIQKGAPFLPIDGYIISCGGLYVRGNKVSKFIEKKIIIKMIPTTFSINGDPPSESGSEKKFKKGSWTIKDGRTFYNQRDSSGKFTAIEA